MDLYYVGRLGDDIKGIRRLSRYALSFDKAIELQQAKMLEMNQDDASKTYIDSTTLGAVLAKPFKALRRAVINAWHTSRPGIWVEKNLLGL